MVDGPLVAGADVGGNVDAAEHQEEFRKNIPKAAFDEFLSVARHLGAKDRPGLSLKRTASMLHSEDNSANVGGGRMGYAGVGYMLAPPASAGKALGLYGFVCNGEGEFVAHGGSAAFRASPLAGARIPRSALPPVRWLQPSLRVSSSLLPSSLLPSCVSYLLSSVPPDSSCIV